MKRTVFKFAAAVFFSASIYGLFSEAPFEARLYCLLITIVFLQMAALEEE